MKNLNKAVVDALFQREAVLIGREDCVPECRVSALFGKDAVEHVWHLDSTKIGQFKNLYGAGDFSISYVTYRGFLAAASFYNVQQIRKETENCA